MANEDKSTRYQRLRRRTRLIRAAWQITFLFAVVVTGLASTIRSSIEPVSGSRALLLVPLYLLVLATAYALVALPLAFYQDVVLERRYQLSREPAGRWLARELKAAVVLLVATMAAAIVVVLLLRWRAATWWVAAAVLFTTVLVVLARYVPALLVPMFADVRRLSNERLHSRLVTLAARAGAPVVDVCEWQVGTRTRKANAALVGAGRSRRILVSDTLLEGHSDDEIETVIAHELGHHVHRDVWLSIAVDALLVTAGLFVADRVLSSEYGRLGLAGKADVAGLPLLMLTGLVVSHLLRPFAYALSRAQERRADRYALDMTQNATAFISTLKRLSARNLAEERPSMLIEVLFHSHPTAAARIAAAESWTAREERPAVQRAGV